MIIKRLLVTAFILGLACPVTMAESDCRVQLSRGWGQGTGKGAIVMKKNGKLCGTTLHSEPTYGIPVDTIKVLTAPKNGTVSIEVPKFLYTPREGFTGSDRFELTAEGPGQGGRGRVKMTGEITVQVDP
jgi:hypothetical protein